MPAKDFYHDTVRNALEQDGWMITHDPYTLKVGRRKGYIDLGAEIIGAEKDLEKIAVEIKNFLGPSPLDQFEDALGQFIVYLKALQRKEADRILYLAIPETFYLSFFDDPFFVEIAQDYQLRLLVFDENSQTISTWIK